MSLVINTNISSLNAQNNLTKSQSALATATQRLSSGLKINSAADNAAGFAISQRYTTQIGGLQQASSNASDAINLAQTAGSALDQVTANLQAIRDLAVQSANGTYTDADRSSIDQEVQQRLAEITRIANQTTFNGSNVLDGSMQTKSFQIGANVGQTISVNLGTSVKSSAMGQIATSSTGDISALFGTTAATPGTPYAGTAGTATTDWSSASAVSGLGVVNYNGTSVDWSTASTVTDAASAASWLQGKLGAGYTVTDGGGTTGALTIAGPTSAGTPASSGLTLAAGDLNIDGKDITGSFATVQDLSDAINAAGITGVSSAVSGDGKSLNLYANSALTIYGTAADSASTATNALKFSGAAATSGAATAITASGSLQGSDVKSVDDANALISRVDVALKSVSDFAAQLGAVQNRFQSTISTVAAQTTNLQASQSTIQDADFAAETANLSKANVLQQAGISVLAQANSNPQQVLKLLQ
ncbi:flagellin/flagellar hook associated protein [Dyella solisilvae]|uniref:Flagellin n=1 Tax=Dyella solisilvae TaxID=1920168 RepID=A0A370K509_9GAMM|nr:flagellin [Dyella solisilvae]RDI97724.1 flagellin/flagellar hook associated protein [Dyella solisilvae]